MRRLGKTHMVVQVPCRNTPENMVQEWEWLKSSEFPGRYYSTCGFPTITFNLTENWSQVTCKLCLRNRGHLIEPIEDDFGPHTSRIIKRVH